MCVAIAEVAVRVRIKLARGKWTPDLKVWELRDRQAVALKLSAGNVAETGIQY